MENFTFGDLIVLQLALQKYIKDVDLTTSAGHYCSQLVAKIECQMNKLAQAGNEQIPLKSI